MKNACYYMAFKFRNRLPYIKRKSSNANRDQFATILKNIEDQLKSLNRNLNEKKSRVFLYITIAGALVVFLSTVIENYLIPTFKYKKRWYETFTNAMNYQRDNIDENITKLNDFKRAYEASPTNFQAFDSCIDGYYNAIQPYLVLEQNLIDIFSQRSSALKKENRMSKNEANQLRNYNRSLHDSIFYYENICKKDTLSVRRHPTKGYFILVARNKYIDTLNNFYERIRTRYYDSTSKKVSILSQRLDEYEDDVSRLEDVLNHFTLLGALITLVGTVGGTMKK
jgi:hypothetical protein